jgi:hypothetical protein
LKHRATACHNPAPYGARLANSITQDFANESKKKFDVAEKIKIDEGFVSLGGAYPDIREFGMGLGLSVAAWLLLIGLAAAFGFFVPGYKYYRQRARKKN